MYKFKLKLFSIIITISTTAANNLAIAEIVPAANDTGATAKRNDRYNSNTINIESGALDKYRFDLSFPAPN